MQRIDDHPLAADREWGEVRFFSRSNGQRLAEEYYDQLTDIEKAQFVVRFERIASTGRLNNESQYRRLHDKGDLYEFKTPNHRITCVQCRRTWFLLHGFAKKSQKANREINRALELSNELNAFLNAGGREQCRG